MRLLLLFVFLFSSCAFAASSEIRYPEINPVEEVVFEGKATFESLSEDSILPKKKYSISGDEAKQNPNLTQELGEELPFPLKNFGYTSGGQGVNLGGRTIEDTQVTTLGVPLSLPQGGGADLSMFPSFLWSSFSISSAPSQAGYSPQAASGSLDLSLWTRETLLGKSGPYKAEVTGYYDRRLQSFSIGSRYPLAAIKAGAEFGDQEGPAGSMSWVINKNPDHQMMLHVLGSDLKSSPPGSIQFPSPQAKQKVWRIIPVLEMNHTLSPELIMQSTLFADVHRFQYEDPSTFNSDTRTYQYGIENAFLFEDYTVGFSARYVRLASSYFENHDEWPLHGSLNREFKINEKLILAGGLTLDYVNLVGAGYGGKIGLRQKLSELNSLFTEVRTLPKFPSLSARYYQLGSKFIGYPNLKPEQVTFAILGHEYKNQQTLNFTNYIKAEHRKNVQVLNGTTMSNSGTAYLFSLNQDAEVPIAKFATLKNSALLSTSHLQALNISYPDLPRVSDRAQLSFHPEEIATLNIYAQLVGDSQSVGPTHHAGYALYDVSLHKSVDFIFPKLQLSAGVQNIFDRRAEVVLDYPLPGRLIQLSLSGQF